MASSHQNPLFVSLDLKGTVQENEETSNTSRQTVTTTRNRSGVVLQLNRKRAEGKKNLKKRRRSLQFGAIRREKNGIRRRVRTLKRLIPNSDSKSVEGLDGLFRETANYILCLQSRVRLMQMMVKALADSDES